MDDILIYPVPLLLQACPDKNCTLCHKNFKGKTIFKEGLINCHSSSGVKLPAQYTVQKQVTLVTVSKDTGLG